MGLLPPGPMEFLPTFGLKDPDPPGKGEPCPNYVLLCVLPASVASVTYIANMAESSAGVQLLEGEEVSEVLALMAWLGSGREGSGLNLKDLPHQLVLLWA